MSVKIPSAARKQQLPASHGSFTSGSPEETGSFMLSSNDASFASASSGSSVETAYDQHVPEYPFSYNVEDGEEGEEGEEDEEPFTNLIVTFLPQAATEDMLKDLFSVHGPVSSCRVIRDDEGRPKGYGFVDFCHAADAKSAHDDLNGMRLLSKRLKVSRARPRSESIVNANLHVSGVPGDWDVGKLESLFGNFGDIISCKILKDPIGGQGKGIGFVRYDLRIQAEEAQRCMDRYQLPGQRHLTVNFAHTGAGSPRDRRRNQSNGSGGSQERFPLEFEDSKNWASPSARKFPEQMPIQYSTNQAQQFQPATYFVGVADQYGMQSGPVYNQVQAYSYQQPYLQQGHISSNNFGGVAQLVEYNSYPVGQYVTQQQTVLPHVQPRSGLNSEEGVAMPLYVENLAGTVSEGILHGLFAQYGEVISATILHSKFSGKNYAFVNMTRRVDAEVAMGQLNGMVMHGRAIKVEYKKRPRYLR